MTELAPGLQTLLSGMKPGDISEPLRTPKGYQLLKLETMTPEEVLPPEQVRDRIAEKLYAAKREVELRKYLAGCARKPSSSGRTTSSGRLTRRDSRPTRRRRPPLALLQPPLPIPWRRLATDREPLVMSQAVPAQAPERRHAGLRSGRAAATSAPYSISSPSVASRRSCRRHRAGAVGKIGRRRSTGRCSQVTASHALRQRAGFRS